MHLYICLWKRISLARDDAAFSLLLTDGKLQWLLSLLGLEATLRPPLALVPLRSQIKRNTLNATGAFKQYVQIYDRRNYNITETPVSERHTPNAGLYHWSVQIEKPVWTAYGPKKTRHCMQAKKTIWAGKKGARTLFPAARSNEPRLMALFKPTHGRKKAHTWYSSFGDNLCIPQRNYGS